MSALPREKAAIASSVSSTCSFLAMMLGVMLSCMLLTLDLNASGYSGPVGISIFMISHSTLAGFIGYITLAAGVLLLASAGASALRHTRFAGLPAEG
jgi:hypothetical protein